MGQLFEKYITPILHPYNIATILLLVAYSMCYEAYSALHKISAYNFVLWITLINCCAAMCALWFHGRFIALIAVISASLVPTFVMDDFFSHQQLVAYCIALLVITLLISYAIDWPLINLFSVMGYLLYNPILFRATGTVEQGLLSLDDVLWIMRMLFTFFTVVPFLYGCLSHKQRLFESISIALSGAYTFAMSRFVIEMQLKKVKDLPFFLKIFVRDGIPTMTSVHEQMFLLYTSIYAILLAILILLNRRSTLILATLVNMCCLSFFGLMYVHSATPNAINYVRWLHKLVAEYL